MLRDSIKPLQHHCSGIPKEVQLMLNRLSTLKVVDIKGGANQKLLDFALDLYDKLLKQLESYEAIGDAKCPTERVERAAEIMGHMVIDLAFVHKIFGAPDNADSSGL